MVISARIFCPKKPESNLLLLLMLSGHFCRRRMRFQLSAGQLGGEFARHMTKRTPQEKKKLSYERDRRTVYGNSPQAARKCIPIRKALRNRANRHQQNQQISYQGPTPDPDLADQLESLVHHRAPQQWKKYPDAPLAEVIASKSEDRAVMREQGGRSALVSITWVEPEE